MLWPRRSTRCTRPSSSATRALGRTSTPPVLATAEWVHWYGHHPDTLRHRDANPRRARSRLGARHPPPGTITTGNHRQQINQPPQNPGLDKVCRGEVLEQPPDRGLKMEGADSPQHHRAQVGTGQVCGVLPYRCWAPVAGQHPGDGRGQHRGQVVAHTAAVPGISHPLERPGPEVGVVGQSWWKLTSARVPGARD